MSRTQETGVGLERLRAASAAALCALALLGGVLVAFRLRPAEALSFGLAVQGPRVLLTAAVAAALAVAACLARERGADLVRRELWLFGASAGGALGGALWSGRLGASTAVIGSVLGAALFAAALDLLHRMRRAFLFLLGAAHAGAWYACLYGAVYAKGALGPERARLAFWAGDLSHATWVGAGITAATAFALIAIAAFSAAAQRATTRATIETVLLGLAIGAAGPIAFVGIVGAGVAGLVSPAGDAKMRLALGALVSAGALALADSAQRKLLGGYAFAPNVVTAFVALPVLYIGCARARQRAEGRTRRVLDAIEYTVVLSVSAFGYYVVYRIGVAIYAFA